MFFQHEETNLKASNSISAMFAGNVLERNSDTKTTCGDVKTELTIQDSHLCSTTRRLNDLPAAV